MSVAERGPGEREFLDNHEALKIPRKSEVYEQVELGVVRGSVFMGLPPMTVRVIKPGKEKEAELIEQEIARREAALPHGALLEEEVSEKIATSWHLAAKVVNLGKNVLLLVAQIFITLLSILALGIPLLYLRNTKFYEFYKLNFPKYLEVVVNGNVSYYQRSAALRLGYKDVLITTPLPRMASGRLDPKPSSPLAKRKLELVNAMVGEQIEKDKEKIKKTLLDDVMQEGSNILASEDPESGRSALLTGDASQRTFIRRVDELTILNCVPKSLLKWLRKYDLEIRLKSSLEFFRGKIETSDDFRYELHKTRETVREEMINKYDHISSDSKEYHQFAALIDDKIKYLKDSIINMEAASVIDVAGRIETLSHGSDNQNVKYVKVEGVKHFFDLITGRLALPKELPGAAELNAQAAKAEKDRQALRSSSEFRKAILSATPEKIYNLNNFIVQYENSSSEHYTYNQYLEAIGSVIEPKLLTDRNLADLKALVKRARIHQAAEYLKSLPQEKAKIIFNCLDELFSLYPKKQVEDFHHRLVTQKEVMETLTSNEMIKLSDALGIEHQLTPLLVLDIMQQSGLVEPSEEQKAGLTKLKAIQEATQKRHEANSFVSAYDKFVSSSTKGFASAKMWQLEDEKGQNQGIYYTGKTKPEAQEGKKGEWKELSSDDVHEQADKYSTYEVSFSNAKQFAIAFKKDAQMAVRNDPSERQLEDNLVAKQAKKRELEKMLAPILQLEEKLENIELEEMRSRLDLLDAQGEELNVLNNRMTEIASIKERIEDEINSAQLGEYASVDELKESLDDVIAGIKLLQDLSLTSAAERVARQFELRQFARAAKESFELDRPIWVKSRGDDRAYVCSDRQPPGTEWRKMANWEVFAKVSDCLKKITPEALADGSPTAKEMQALAKVVPILKKGETETEAEFLEEVEAQVEQMRLFPEKTRASIREYCETQQQLVDTAADNQHLSYNDLKLKKEEIERQIETAVKGYVFLKTHPDQRDVEGLEGERSRLLEIIHTLEQAAHEINEQEIPRRKALLEKERSDYPQSKFALAPKVDLDDPSRGVVIGRWGSFGRGFNPTSEQFKTFVEDYEKDRMQLSPSSELNQLPPALQKRAVDLAIYVHAKGDTEFVNEKRRVGRSDPALAEIAAKYEERLLEGLNEAIAAHAQIEQEMEAEHVQQLSVEFRGHYLPYQVGLIALHAALFQKGAQGLSEREKEKINEVLGEGVESLRIIDAQLQVERDPSKVKELQAQRARLEQQQTSLGLFKASITEELQQLVRKQIATDRGIALMAKITATEQLSAKKKAVVKKFSDKDHDLLELPSLQDLKEEHAKEWSRFAELSPEERKKQIDAFLWITRDDVERFDKIVQKEAAALQGAEVEKQPQYLEMMHEFEQKRLSGLPKTALSGLRPTDVELDRCILLLAKEMDSHQDLFDRLNAGESKAADLPLIEKFLDLAEPINLKIAEKDDDFVTGYLDPLREGHIRIEANNLAEALNNAQVMSPEAEIDFSSEDLIRNFDRDVAKVTNLLNKQGDEPLDDLEKFQISLVRAKAARLYENARSRGVPASDPDSLRFRKMINFLSQYLDGYNLAEVRARVAAAITAGNQPTIAELPKTASERAEAALEKESREFQDSPYALGIYQVMKFKAGVPRRAMWFRASDKPINVVGRETGPAFAERKPAVAGQWHEATLEYFKTLDWPYESISIQTGPDDEKWKMADAPVDRSKYMAAYLFIQKQLASPGKLSAEDKKWLETRMAEVKKYFGILPPEEPEKGKSEASAGPAEAIGIPSREDIGEHRAAYPSSIEIEAALNASLEQQRTELQTCIESWREGDHVGNIVDAWTGDIESDSRVAKQNWILNEMLRTPIDDSAIEQLLDPDGLPADVFAGFARALMLREFTKGLTTPLDKNPQIKQLLDVVETTQKLKEGEKDALKKYCIYANSEIAKRNKSQPTPVQTRPVESRERALAKNFTALLDSISDPDGKNAIAALDEIAYTLTQDELEIFAKEVENLDSSNERIMDSLRAQKKTLDLIHQGNNENAAKLFLERFKDAEKDEPFLDILKHLDVDQAIAWMEAVRDQNIAGFSEAMQKELKLYEELSYYSTDQSAAAKAFGGRSLGSAKKLARWIVWTMPLGKVEAFIEAVRLGSSANAKANAQLLQDAYDDPNAKKWEHLRSQESARFQPVQVEEEGGSFVEMERKYETEEGEKMGRETSPSRGVDLTNSLAFDGLGVKPKPRTEVLTPQAASIEVERSREQLRSQGIILSAAPRGHADEARPAERLLVIKKMGDFSADTAQDALALKTAVTVAREGGVKCELNVSDGQHQYKQIALDEKDLRRRLKMGRVEFFRQITNVKPQERGKRITEKLEALQESDRKLMEELESNIASGDPSKLVAAVKTFCKLSEEDAPYIGAAIQQRAGEDPVKLEALAKFVLAIGNLKDVDSPYMNCFKHLDELTVIGQVAAIQPEEKDFLQRMEAIAKASDLGGKKYTASDLKVIEKYIEDAEKIFRFQRRGSMRPLSFPWAVTDAAYEKVDIKTRKMLEKAHDNIEKAHDNIEKAIKDKADMIKKAIKGKTAMLRAECTRVSSDPNFKNLHSRMGGNSITEDLDLDHAINENWANAWLAKHGNVVLSTGMQYDSPSASGDQHAKNIASYLFINTVITHATKISEKMRDGLENYSKKLGNDILTTATVIKHCEVVSTEASNKQLWNAFSTLDVEKISDLVKILKPGQLLRVTKDILAVGEVDHPNVQALLYAVQEKCWRPLLLTTDLQSILANPNSDVEKLSEFWIKTSALLTRDSKSVLPETIVFTNTLKKLYAIFYEHASKEVNDAIAKMHVGQLFLDSYAVPLMRKLVGQQRQAAEATRQKDLVNAFDSDSSSMDMLVRNLFSDLTRQRRLEQEVKLREENNEIFLQQIKNIINNLNSSQSQLLWSDFSKVDVENFPKLVEALTDDQMTRLVGAIIPRDKKQHPNAQALLELL